MKGIIMELTSAETPQSKIINTVARLASNKIVQGTVVVAAVGGLAFLSHKLKKSN